jgi:hypothetical protein
MLQSEHQLGNVEPCSVLAEPSFLLQVPKEFSTALVVGDKVQLLFGLERKLESDKEWAFQAPLQDLALSDRMGDLLLGDDLTLREYLHRINSSSVLLSDLEDTTERSSTDEFQEFEVGWLEVGFVL